MHHFTNRNIGSPSSRPGAMLRSLQPPSPRRRTIGALAAIGAVLATALVDVQPTAAGALCDRLGLCGEAINRTDRSMIDRRFQGQEDLPRRGRQPAVHDQDPARW